jgi:hypothetical protein
MSRYLPTRMAYARSLELNPDNEHAKGELVKLRK